MYFIFFLIGNLDKFCNYVFRFFDGDNSGKIDFKEFLFVINIIFGGDFKSKLNWVFIMYDIDGNGIIEKDEMVEIIGVNIFYIVGFIIVYKNSIILGCNLYVVKMFYCSRVFKFIIFKCKLNDSIFFIFCYCMIK